MSIGVDQDYAYASGRVRALEAKLFDTQRLARFMEAASGEEVLKQLVDGGYAIELGPEGCLKRELERLYTLIESICPDRSISRLFGLRYVFHDIKVHLRKGLPGALQGVPLGLSPEAKEVLEQLEGEHYGSLPEGVREAVMAALPAREAGDPKRLDMILDKHSVSLQVKMALETRNKVIIQYFQGIADMANLGLCLRAKARGDRSDLDFLVDGGTIPLDVFSRVEKMSWEEVPSAFGTSPVTVVAARGVQGYVQRESFSPMEKATDEYIMRLGRQGRYSAMGAEVIAGYIVTKEAEIKNIRLILAGKEAGKETADMKERLRDIHG